MATASQYRSGLRYTLAKPAIELAVAEVRFAAAADAVAEPVGLQFRDVLRDTGLAFENFEPVVTQEVNIEMTPSGGRATGVSASQGWACSDAATGILVTVMPLSVAVQTRTYHRWSATLEPVIETSLRAATELLRPSLRTRIGLRYVNRFVNSAARSPLDWEPQFHPSLLGPVASGPLSEHVKSSQQQLELGWDGGLAGLVRHGAFVDAAANHAYSYLLDLDVFDTATEAFQAHDCLQRLTEMNRAAAELFKSLLAEGHLDSRGFHAELPVEASSNEGTT